MAALTSSGNPDLRWEKVNTFNLGMDIASFSRRIQIGIEYYKKKASDLIGKDFMDPTTGIIDGAVPLIQNKINYANMTTKGLDLMINSENFTGALKWQTSVIFNYVVNKVTNFNTSAAISLDSYLGAFGMVPPAKGKSKDLIYALPWNGLDPSTGLPLIYIDGNTSTNYSGYYLSHLKFTDLLSAGVTSPPYTGSIRNAFSYRGFHLAALITWKAGHVFRRTSMEPGGEWRQSSVWYHSDYFLRWKKPGDEQFTSVPANTNTYDTYLAQSYSLSSALITKGDHLRLQEIEASYTFSNKIHNKLRLSNLKLFMYARNLGLIWKINKNNLDPDYPNADYPASKSIAFGLQVEF